ncbi:cell division protein FtsQ/DivIB [Leuconostoc sp. JNUCC 76]
MEKIKSQFMKRRPLQLWISLAAFVVLIVGLILSLQPWRTIGSVNIDSNMLTKQQVQKYVGINDKTPRWRVFGQTAFIAHQLIKKDNKVYSADINLNSNVVSIKVVENISAGFVKKNGQWYSLNRQGKSKKVDKPNGNAPIYSNFKNNAQLTKTAKTFSRFELSLRQNISQIIYSPTKDNNNRLKIIMTDGNTVLATLKTFGEKMVYYPGIAAQMQTKGIIDLQYGAYSYGYGSK